MEKELDLIVVCKKTKTGEGTYVALAVDLGYRQCILSFERAVISEITNVPCGKLAIMPVDTKCKVGTIKIIDK